LVESRLDSIPLNGFLTIFESGGNHEFHVLDIGMVAADIMRTSSKQKLPGSGVFTFGCYLAKNSLVYAAAQVS